MTKNEYAFLMQQKDEIEREYMRHFQRYGHDAETCILKDKHIRICNALDELHGISGGENE